MSCFVGPFRYVLTLILAVAVPFCCCSFQVLMNACADCVEPSHAVMALGAESSSHQDGDGSHPHQGSKSGQIEGGIVTMMSNRSLSPVGTGHKHGTTDSHGDNDGDNHGDTVCSKHEKKVLTSARLAVELSTTVLVDVLPWPEIAQLTSSFPTDVQSRSDWAQARPPTSLLSLHCALIV